MKNQTLVKIVFGAMILMALAGGAFLRLWKLGEIPPGVHYDEAYNAIDAIKTMESNDYKIFYPENNGREGLWINAIALNFKFFGVNVFTFRMLSAFVGIATLIGFFLLLRQLKLAKLSVFVGLSALATSFWHLNFSRITFRAIMVPLLLTWIFYLFLKGLHSKKYGLIFFALSGLLTGLGFHTYISFRVAPLIFIIVIIGYLILEKKDFVKKQWKNALIFLAGVLITSAPIFYYFFTNSSDFVGRSNSVSIFNSQELTPVQAFGKSLALHLGSFLVYGDPNQRHNNNSLPLIPAAWGILFVAGFIFSLKEIVQTFKRKNKTDLFDAAVVAQAIFWVMLIPGVISIEGVPHALRIIGVIPAVFIFIAIPFDYLLRLYRKIGFSKKLKMKTWRYSIAGISIIMLAFIALLSGVVQSFSYFYEWGKNKKTIESFDRKTYDFGNLIYQTTTKKNNFLVVPEDKNIFSEGKESSLRPAEFSGYPNIKNFIFRYPLEALKNETCDDSLYLFFEADVEIIKQFEKKCPLLQAEKIKPEKGLYEFWIMK